MAKKAPKPFDDIRFKNTRRTVDILNKVDNIDKGVKSLHKLFTAQLGTASASSNLGGGNIGRSLVPLNRGSASALAPGVRNINSMSISGMLVEKLGAQQALFQNVMFGNIRGGFAGGLALPAPVGMPAGGPETEPERKKRFSNEDFKNQPRRQPSSSEPDKLDEFLDEFKEIRAEATESTHEELNKVLLGPFGKMLMPLQSTLVKFAAPNFVQKMFGFGKDEEESKMHDDIEGIKKNTDVLSQKRMKENIPKLVNKQMKEDLPKEIGKVGADTKKGVKVSEEILKEQKEQSLMGFLKEYLLEGVIVAALIAGISYLLGSLGLKGFKLGNLLAEEIKPIFKEITKAIEEGMKPITDLIKEFRESKVAEALGLSKSAEAGKASAEAAKTGEELLAEAEKEVEKGTAEFAKVAPKLGKISKVVKLAGKLAGPAAALMDLNEAKKAKERGDQLSAAWYAAQAVLDLGGPMATGLSFGMGMTNPYDVAKARQQMQPAGMEGGYLQNIAYSPTEEGKELQEQLLASMDKMADIAQQQLAAQQKAAEKPAKVEVVSSNNSSQQTNVINNGLSHKDHLEHLQVQPAYAN